MPASQPDRQLASQPAQAQLRRWPTSQPSRLRRKFANKQQEKAFEILSQNLDFLIKVDCDAPPKPSKNHVEKTLLREFSR